jgi:hypothetical protein
MVSRPTSAFIFSLIGGIITLISGLISINSWFILYSMSGTSFTYWLLGDLFSFTAMEALVLFVIGTICGLLIVVGAVLQYSGKKSRVRMGSFIVVIASVVGALPTFFGFFIGFLLSVVGAAKGLSWDPSTEAALALQRQ